MTTYNFALQAYPFTLAVSNTSAALLDAVRMLYPPQVLSPLILDQVYDFDLCVKRQPWSWRGTYLVGSASEHFRMSDVSHLPAIFEWAFNWSVASFQHHYLAIHAAVLQRNDVTVVMPAAPGSGKSTLAAMLMLEGWRLLSDETCLIDTVSGQVLPNVRPVSLKNQSIDVIKNRYPDAALTLNIENTIKGTVSYLLPSRQSWHDYKLPTFATHVVFPKYQSNTDFTVFERMPKSSSFMQLAVNSFNYSVLGVEGFKVLSQFVQRIKAYQLTYADTDEALTLFETLS